VNKLFYFPYCHQGIYMKKLLLILILAGAAQIKCASTSASKGDTPAYASREEYEASNAADNMDAVAKEKEAHCQAVMVGASDMQKARWERQDQRRVLQQKIMDGEQRMKDILQGMLQLAQARVLKPGPTYSPEQLAQLQLPLLPSTPHVAHPKG
jgi:hypothetical protein